MGQGLSGVEVRCALKVAVVVGTILNLINQGDVVWGEAELNTFKAGLTYCVPFCVSLFGAHMALRRRG